jgi:DNA invertase Pin-like site-specific DNA recombinase
MTKPTKPCDLYIRVSAVRGRSGESFISPDVQESQCRGAAQSRGIEVGLKFTDLDQSGRKMSRPEFNKALARIRSGVSGGIIVARIDRFSRTLQGALETLAEITEAGGVMIAADGDFDTTTPMGVFARDLMLGVAQLYSAQLAARWAEAHGSMIERGVHSGSAPVGYAPRRKNGVNTEYAGKPLVVNGNAEHVREAYAMRAGSPRANWADVARYLTAQGVPTKSGVTEWSPGGARKLLSNRAYLGEARHGTKVMPGAHEALVDPVTFRLANHKSARLSGERESGTDGKPGRLLGGGLVRCGTCGAGMVHGRTVQKKTDGSGERVYEFLRCPTRRGGGAHAAIALGLITPYLTGIAEGAAEAAPRSEEAAELKDRLWRAERDLALVDAEQEEMDAITYGRARAQAVRERDAADAALSAALLDVGGQVPDWTDVLAGRAFLKQALGRVEVAPGRGPVAERVTVSA